MKRLFKSTLFLFLLSGNLLASTNGIGGSNGGSNGMDWSEIFTQSTRYRIHFPTIIYQGSQIGINNFCDNGNQLVTPQEVPIMVMQNDGGDSENGTKILEYQRVSIPRWRMVMSMCQGEGIWRTDSCSENLAGSTRPLKYKVQVDDLDANMDERQSFEKTYEIPSCEEWQYQRQSLDVSNFWEYISGA